MSDPTQEGYDALCFSDKEDEVKRLVAENEELRTTMQAIADGEDVRELVVWQIAEIVRLRAALQAIADSPTTESKWRKATWQMAQEALQQQEIAAG